MAKKDKSTKPDLDKIFSKYNINQHTSFRDVKEILSALVNGEEESEEESEAQPD
jgi:hypothetical protein